MPPSDESKLSAVPSTVGPETLDAEPTSNTVRMDDTSMATSDPTADAVFVPEAETVMPSSPAPITAPAAEPLPSPYVVSRHVFHVPERSNFVFIEKLKQLKGSDASNLHDEEPAGNDQLDFSDDEEEARYKRSLKGAGEKRKYVHVPFKTRRVCSADDCASRRGESMAPGQAWRGQTPSQMHDQDLSLSENLGSTPFYGSNPYDAHGPYDTGFTGGPPPNSGRTLMAYDDPYANSNDPMNAAQVSTAIDELIASSTSEPSTSGPSASPSASNPVRPPRGRGRGGFSGGDRGRGGGSAGERGRGRGRGRGADSRGRGRGRGGMQQHDRGDAQQYERRSSVSSQSAPIVQHRELSPTSLAIARATGQHMDGTSFAPAPTAGHMQMHPPGWGFRAPGAGQPQYGYGFHQAPGGHGWSQPQPPPPAQQQPMQQGFVQPHINPRFAAQWGWNMQNSGWQPPPGGDHQQGGGGTQ
jgi:H/ACA ribonucleoprotein complex non-core subunit NAF1